MKTVLKEIVAKTQEFPNEERLAVQYLREDRMPFSKAAELSSFQCTIILSLVYSGGSIEIKARTGSSIKISERERG